MLNLSEKPLIATTYPILCGTFFGALTVENFSFFFFYPISIYITKSANIMKSDHKQCTLMPMDCTNQPHIWKTQCRKGMGFQKNNGPNSKTRDRPQLAQGWGQLKDSCWTCQFLMDISNFFLSRNITPFTAEESLNRFYIWLHILFAKNYALEKRVT